MGGKTSSIAQIGGLVDPNLRPPPAEYRR